MLCTAAAFQGMAGAKLHSQLGLHSPLFGLHVLLTKCIISWVPVTYPLRTFVHSGNESTDVVVEHVESRQNTKTAIFFPTTAPPQSKTCSAVSRYPVARFLCSCSGELVSSSTPKPPSRTERGKRQTKMLLSTKRKGYQNDSRTRGGESS